MRDVSMNSEMFVRHEYLNMNKVIDFLNEHNYFNKSTHDDYLILRSMVKGSNFCNRTLFSIAQFIVEHTEFDGYCEGSISIEEEVAYVMTMLYQYAVETIFTFRG